MHRVLIFDDDKDILELCSIILQTKGFKTIGEMNCRNLLEKIQTANPDVILMDNWIPDHGGVDATRKIKADNQTKHIPVIFFSANNNVEKFSSEAGAEYFIQKPFDISHLELTIRKALDARPQS